MLLLHQVLVAVLPHGQICAECFLSVPNLQFHKQKYSLLAQQLLTSWKALGSNLRRRGEKRRRERMECGGHGEGHLLNF